YYSPGGVYYDYPTGIDVPTTCATPTAALNSANCYSAVGDLTPKGSYTGSPSPYGTFDQGGNLWEWNEAIIYGFRGERGGSWASIQDNMAAVTATRDDPASGRADIGFRLVMIPEPTSEHAAEFIPLGDAIPSAVSADGSVVVGSGGLAFRWTYHGGIVGIFDLQGEISGVSISDVSSHGSVVAGTGGGQSGYGYCQQPIRWTPDGGMIGLGDLPGGIFIGHGLGISADGSAVVGWSSSAPLPGAGGVIEAFRWTANEGMVGLGFLPGGVSVESEAYDASADGSVVVGRSSSASGLFEAFRWTAEGGMVGLGDFPGG